MRRYAVLTILIFSGTICFGTTVDVYGHYGFSSAVMPQRWNPLTIVLSTDDHLADAELILESTVDPAFAPDPTIYRVTLPVEIDRSRFIRTVVPVGSVPLDLRYRIVSGGETVASGRIPPRQWNAPPELVVEVGTVEVETTEERNRRGIETYYARPDVAVLPDHPAAWDAADGIVVGDGAFERASSLQIASLRRALEGRSPLRLPIVAATTPASVSDLLADQNVYEFPSRWIIMAIFLAYTVSLAALGRRGSPAPFLLIPVLLSALFLLLYGVIHPPPRVSLVELQRFESIDGERGAILIRDLYFMTTAPSDRELLIPENAVVLPRPGSTTAVRRQGDRYLITLSGGAWSTVHITTAEAIPVPAIGDGFSAPPVELLQPPRAPRVVHSVSVIPIDGDAGDAR